MAARWDYVLTAGAQATRTSLEVLATMPDGSGLRVTYRGSVDGGNTTEAVLRCSAERADDPWALLSGAEIPIVSGELTIRDAPVLGETVVERAVRVDAGLGALLGTSRLEIERRTTVVGRQTVDTPAGSFDTLALDIVEIHHLAERVERGARRRYLAEGIGLIREEILDDAGTVVAELALERFQAP